MEHLRRRRRRRRQLDGQCERGCKSKHSHEPRERRPLHPCCQSNDSPNETRERTKLSTSETRRALAAGGFTVETDFDFCTAKFTYLVYKSSGAMRQWSEAVGRKCHTRHKHADKHIERSHDLRPPRAREAPSSFIRAAGATKNDTRD